MVGTLLEELDIIDKEIIKFLQDNADITLSDIAGLLGYTQPTIGLRVSRLRSLGLLEKYYGINLENVGLLVAVVQFTSKFPKKIFEISQKYPFIINCIEQSGRRNIMLEIIGKDIKSINKLIDILFRNDSDILDIKFELISRSLNQQFAQINLDIFNDDSVKFNND